MNLLAKIAMTANFLYYLLVFGYLWVGQITGLHNDVWEAFELPTQEGSPSMASLALGSGLTTFALASLGFAYVAVWKVLNGGRMQDFRILAIQLKRISYGLLGFWLGYNLISGVMQYFLVIGVEGLAWPGFEWDPLDIDILFLILAIVLLAISGVMQRAWEAEEENKLFL